MLPSLPVDELQEYIQFVKVRRLEYETSLREDNSLKELKVVSWSSNNYCASLTNFSSNIREFDMVRDAPA